MADLQKFVFLINRMLLDLIPAKLCNVRRPVIVDIPRLRELGLIVMMGNVHMFNSNKTTLFYDLSICQNLFVWRLVVLVCFRFQVSKGIPLGILHIFPEM